MHAAGPFRSAASEDAQARAADSKRCKPTSAAPFLSQNGTPAAKATPPPPSPTVQIAAADPIPEVPIEKEEDDELDIPDPEVEDVLEARAEIELLRQKAIELTGKLQQTKQQLTKQLACEADVRELVSEAQTEIERLRNRIPREYDSRGMDDTETDLPDYSIQAEAAFDVSTPPIDKRYRSRPKKGVLGMEVALYGDFVQVQRLTAGGACQQAGIVEGDIIRTWNGKLITCQNDFVRATSVCGAGIPLNVEVQREGVKGLLTFEVIPKRKA